MAGNVKGITIEFNGDTTKLDKALRQIKNSTKDIDKELKNVDKALKFNPTNIDLWRQKQELLTQKIEQTKENLKKLKDAQAQLDAQGVDKSSEEYRKLQREIIETESKLKHFEAEQRKIGNVKLKAASEQFKELGSRLNEAGQKMRAFSAAAATVTAAIGAVTVKSAKWADDINTMSKKYRISTADLQKYSAAAQLVDVEVETIASSHRKLTKSMSSASKGTGKQAEAFEKLDVAITDSEGNLRDTDAVWNEVISKLGKVENETEREALAMDLLGKSAGNLNPLIEDGGEAYQKLGETLKKYDLDFIDQETLDDANAFNDSLDTMKAVGTVALQQVGTQLSAYLAPAMEKIVDLFGKLAGWFANLSPQTQAIIGIIASVIAVAAPLLIIIGAISSGVGALIGVIGMLTAPMLGVVAAIAAVIAIGVLLYKNWDTIKAKAKALWTNIKTTFAGIKKSIIDAWNNAKTKVTTAVTNMVSSVQNKIGALKNSVKSTFDSIKEKMTSAMQSAKDKIQGVIDKIKGWFPISIGRILSNVKLPHFKISGKFSLDPPSTPSISVSWYKKGGIFDSPSLIGIGEAGPEAVVPLDKLWDKLDKIAEVGSPIVINVYGSDSMSVNELAAAVEQKLIQMQKRRTMAWQ